MKILIVDDMFYIREEIRDILERNGYKYIEEAEDGVEAIAIFHEFKPDIISMDINMPNMNGLEAAKKIKLENRDVKILLCSTIVSYKDIREQGESIGIDAYLSKPFNKDSYMEQFNKLLS